MDTYYLARLLQQFEHADFILGATCAFIPSALFGGFLMYRRLVRKKRNYRRSTDTESSILAFTGFASRKPMMERFYSKRFVLWLWKKWRERWGEIEDEVRLAEGRERYAKDKLERVREVVGDKRCVKK